MERITWLLKLLAEQAPLYELQQRQYAANFTFNI